MIREQLRADGRAVGTTILRVRSTAPRGGDHVLLVATEQPVIRIRPDNKVKSADGRMTAMVTHVRPWRSGRLLRLRVTDGKRAVGTLSPGDTIDWLDTAVFHGSEPKEAPWSKISSISPATALEPLELPADLAAVANRLRTR